MLMQQTNCGCSSKEHLMKKINESSFAVDDILLYLDTHPHDEKAMEFFRTQSAIRNSALKEYAKYYGPLTIDTANDTQSSSWEWVMQPWPWENKGGCR